MRMAKKNLKNRILSKIKDLIYPNRIIARKRILSRAERRFCHENGIDKNIASGVSFDVSQKHKHRNEEYWVRDAIFIYGFNSFDRSPILSQLDTLVINKTARFANAIKKLCNAFIFAHKWQIKKVYHDGFDFLDDDFKICSVRFIKGKPVTGKILKSDFYYNVVLEQLSTDMPSSNEIIPEFAPYLNFSIPPALNNKPKILTIHLRSGDIFLGCEPHSLYGQPPFVFYKKVIESEEWGFVRLVFEDNGNPVILALVEMLKETEVEFDIVSRSLREDLETLAEAEYLVIGRGTFIYPVLCLSNNIRRVYSFEHDERRVWGMQDTPIEFVIVEDEFGGYKDDILKNWKNTEEQNKTMLEYPEEHLSRFKIS